MKKTGLLIPAFIVAMIASLAANAAAPPYIPLQGVLRDSEGSFVDGDVVVQFAVYEAETGGEALWSETQSVLVEDGFFAVYLGDSESIDLAVMRDHGNIWLGITVESDGEMPRVYLGSTPFSGYAEYCGHVPEHVHDMGDMTGTVLDTALPDRIVFGDQTCTGGDKVMGIDISGILVCGEDQGTTYNTGLGLDIAGTILSVDTSVIQVRVTDVCGPGSAMRLINADGTVVCEEDDDSGGDITEVIAGAGLSGGGPSGPVTLSVAGNAVTSSMIQDGTIEGGDISTSTTITASGFAYAAARTHYFSLIPSSFQRFGASDGWAVNDYALYRSDLTQSTYMMAPVDLPDGATVVSLACSVMDVDGANDMRFRLMRKNSGGTSSCGSRSTSGIPGSLTPSVPNSCTETVSNNVGSSSFFIYYVELYTTATSSAVRVNHCSVEYTVESP